MQKLVKKTMAEAQQTNYLQISFWKALSVLAGAILVTIVGTAFTVGGILNNDHFITLANARNIEVLQEEKVDQDVYDVQQEAIIKQLETLNETVEEVLKELRND